MTHEPGPLSSGRGRNKQQNPHSEGSSSKEISRPAEKRRDLGLFFCQSVQGQGAAPILWRRPHSSITLSPHSVCRLLSHGDPRTRATGSDNVYYLRRQYDPYYCRTQYKSCAHGLWTVEECGAWYPRVVIYGPFFNFPPCKEIINIYKKKFAK